MKQVVVCNEKLKNAKQNLHCIDRISMDGVDITVALLETDTISFIPDAPENKNLVLVRKKAFSLNYRDKALIFKSSLYCNQQHERLCYFPIGSEFVGEVAATGEGVTTLSVGDRVIGNGAYPYSGYDGARAGLPTNNASKEYELFHYGKLIKIPDTMPDEVAAGFTIGGQTIGSIIRRMNLRGGENILITAGTSNTSLFAINTLQSKGVNVYVLTTSACFTDQLNRMGVQQVFVLDKTLSLIQNEKFLKVFNGLKGFDSVIDPFYDLYLGKVIPFIKPCGSYYTCGLYDQYLADIDGKFTASKNNYNVIMNTTLVNNISIIGNCLGSTQDLETSVDRYHVDKLNVVVDSVFDGYNVADFLDRTYNQKERFGKVIYQYTS